ncbi:glycerate kinase type-2 family protein [Haloferax profundi]|uniref:Hydroxypyruvate reductase n=1 Tax=Haloferax profundi TaxID=1544718 RepID=A0A0W1RFZ4_9EURY|nr:glycerate kinase [Haloferax profundi]KTG12231.1 hypothetical protein AUR66_19710 [Haloferax profundi]
MITNKRTIGDTHSKEFVLDCIEAGITAAHPKQIVEDTISVEDRILFVEDHEYQLDEYDNVVVVGAGNAAGRISQAIESVLGDTLTSGAIVTDDPVECEIIEMYRGTHPLPSRACVNGVNCIQSLLDDSHGQTLVIAVSAGGGSALLSLPHRGIGFDELRAVTESLLHSGAPIDEINVVRKHLSQVKGGQLAAAAYPATVVNLVLCDVVGDDIGTVASGPFAPDSSSFDDALEIIGRYDIPVPPSVHTVLEQGELGALKETPCQSNDVFERVHHHVIGSGETALHAARKMATERGITAEILSSQVEGEASEAAKFHLSVANEVIQSKEPFQPPVVILSGGETTVTIEDSGNGGPNQEFCLSAAIHLNNPDITVGAVDTDGIDGNADVAGAIIDSATVGPDDLPSAREHLQKHESTGYLASKNATVKTGPTGTNVNDLRVIYIQDTAGDSPSVNSAHSRKPKSE